MALQLHINKHKYLSFCPSTLSSLGLAESQGGLPEPAMKKVPASQPTSENITLLAISPNQEDRQSLESILDSGSWTVEGARSLREATAMLHHGPNLILCEKELPDGNWKDVFREARDLDNPPPLVVVSRQADERLWAEVLNVGGYDVLLKPFERSEVCRVMGMALRHGRQGPVYAA